jgi:hypothetical protein
MDCQDWTPVVTKRRLTKKEAVAKGQSAIHARDTGLTERARLSKLETSDTPVLPKKRINPASIQELIRKRIELKLAQDKADVLCAFPKYTFKNMESQRYIPTEEQKRAIQIHLGVQLRIDTL